MSWVSLDRDSAFRSDRAQGCDDSSTPTFYVAHGQAITLWDLSALVGAT
jgi:hypothetical protein